MTRLSSHSTYSALPTQGGKISQTCHCIRYLPYLDRWQEWFERRRWRSWPKWKQFQLSTVPTMRGKYEKYMAAQNHLDKKTTENASLTWVVWKEEEKAIGYDGQGPKNSWKVKDQGSFCLSDYNTRCDEAEEQAIVHETDSCFPFWYLANSSIILQSYVLSVKRRYTGSPPHSERASGLGKLTPYGITWFFHLFWTSSIPKLIERQIRLLTW